MRSWLSPIHGVTYSAMRVVFGLLFLCHGLQKMFGLLGGTAQPLASLPGVAGIIEALGGLLIAAGFLTPYVAFVASGEMAAAYFMRHFPRAFLPIQNGGELAVLYCFAFLMLAAGGSGEYSLDAVMSRKSAS